MLIQLEVATRLTGSTEDRKRKRNRESMCVEEMERERERKRDNLLRSGTEN